MARVEIVAVARAVRLPGDDFVPAPMVRTVNDAATGLSAVVCTTSDADDCALAIAETRSVAPVVFAAVPRTVRLPSVDFVPRPAVRTVSVARTGFVAVA